MMEEVGELGREEINGFILPSLFIVKASFLGSPLILQGTFEMMMMIHLWSLWGCSYKNTVLLRSVPEFLIPTNHDVKMKLFCKCVLKYDHIMYRII